MSRQGDYIFFCDICGQRYYASEGHKLSTYTGRGGLIVCKHDADKEDLGVKPYTPRVERSVPWARINHTDTTDSSPEVDLESMTYVYFLASSQDGAIITSSQDDLKIIVGEAV